MYDFLLETIVFVSLGVVVYLLARALPRIQEQVDQPSPAIKERVKKIVARLPLSKMDAALNGVFGKFLRKARVVVLKLDNFIHDRLNKLNKTAANGKITPGVVEPPKSEDSQVNGTPQ